MPTVGVVRPDGNDRATAHAAAPIAHRAKSPADEIVLLLRNFILAAIGQLTARWLAIDMSFEEIDVQPSPRIIK